MNGNINYKSNKEINANELAVLFKESGIKRPFDDLIRLKKMIDNSNIFITAWDGGRLIGVARAITDFSYCCYLSDLAVAKDFQKKGVGNNLIKLVQKEITDEITLILLSSKLAMNYYEKVGFNKVENCFIVPRNK